MADGCIQYDEMADAVRLIVGELGDKVTWNMTNAINDQHFIGSKIAVVLVGPKADQPRGCVRVYQPGKNSWVDAARAAIDRYKRRSAGELRA